MLLKCWIIICNASLFLPSIRDRSVCSVAVSEVYGLLSWVCIERGLYWTGGYDWTGDISSPLVMWYFSLVCRQLGYNVGVRGMGTTTYDWILPDLLEDSIWPLQEDSSPSPKRELLLSLVTSVEPPTGWWRPFGRAPYRVLPRTSLTLPGLALRSAIPPDLFLSHLPLWILVGTTYPFTYCLQVEGVLLRVPLHDLKQQSSITLFMHFSIHPLYGPNTPAQFLIPLFCQIHTRRDRAIH